MLKTEPVRPIGTRSVFAHVHHVDPAKHGFQYVDMPEYPAEAMRIGSMLRALRVDLGLSLRDAAKRFGLSVLETSQLERGARTCDWVEARRLLEAAPEPDSAPSDGGDGGGA